MSFKELGIKSREDKLCNNFQCKMLMQNVMTVVKMKAAKDKLYNKH